MTRRGTRCRCCQKRWVHGLYVYVPVGTVRRALAVAELSGSDIVEIISLERLVSLAHSVVSLVEQQLYEAVGQEKVSMSNLVLDLDLGIFCMTN